MKLRMIVWLVGLGLFGALAACGNFPTPPPGLGATPASAPRATPAGTITISVTPVPANVVATRAAGLPGKFVFARGNGTILIQDATGANLRPLVASNGDTLAEFPAFSPDGKQVAYSYNYFDKDGNVVQDLHVINTDGSNPHSVAVPDQVKITYSFPAWSPDGKDIFFTQAYAIPPSSEYAEIDRVSANGGALKTVLKDARLAAISPDGKKIAFRRFDFKIFASSLWIANIDGTGEKQLVDQETFFDIFAARFSPDSTSLVFAGSGEPKKKLPGIALMPAPANDGNCAIGVGALCLVERADAHGLPSDLWLVNLDGTQFERVTHVGSDSPYPAWSADGTRIAFLSEIGTFLVDRQNKTFSQVTSDGGYGGFDWYSK